MTTLGRQLQGLADTLPRLEKGGETSIVSRIEAAVRKDPACISFDERGFATLTAVGGRWEAGRFETPTLAQLKERVLARPRQAGAKVSLSVLTGASPLSDIGTLQGFADEGSLFQVASQFDCLEAMDPYIAPIADYLRDPTQGPRASTSAFPGTFVRHYAAPRIGPSPHPLPPWGEREPRSCSPRRSS